MAQVSAEIGQCRERTARLAGPDPGAWVYLGLMVLIGSSTATAAKFAVRELPVGLLPLVRFGVAGLCLLPIVWRPGLARKWFREDARDLFLAAGLCVPVNQFFFLNGAKLTPTSHVALIYATCPLVVLFVARLSGQERFAPGRLAGVLASVLGVVVIGVGNLMRGGTSGRSELVGDVFILGAVVSWGAYLTVSKRLIARQGPLPALAATFVLGALLDVPIALATMRGGPPLSAASPGAWIGLAYLTLIVTIFGLACQNQALRRLDASQVATAANAAPLLTVLWGVWLLDEPLSPALLIGGALTLAGILWTTRRPAARRIVPSRSNERTCSPLQGLTETRGPG